MTISHMTSSSSSSHPYEWKYHVFISFRGTDTREGFAGHLYSALCRNGIKVFFDEVELEKGEEISPALDTAIRESRIAIVIFSKDYASSTWCLEELAKVIEYSNDKAKGMLVVPVFYLVNPCDVRYQKGSYAEALAKHETRFTDDEKWKIDRWRLALKKAADLTGWPFKHGQMPEYKFIDNIVKSISERISRLLDRAKGIGLHDRMEEMKERPLLPGTEDRIVVYCTSLRGIRKTYDDCRKVLMTLKCLRVAVDERDIYLNASYRKELQNALGCTKEVTLPQVFIRGKYVGNGEEMERLNESGVLEKLLNGFPYQDPSIVCDICGDSRFVSCSNCSGSSCRKVKRCTHCNENGLIRCPRCCS